MCHEAGQEGETPGEGFKAASWKDRGMFHRKGTARSKALEQDRTATARDLQ